MEPNNLENLMKHTPGPWIAMPPDKDCKSWAILKRPDNQYQPGDTYIIAFMAERVLDPNVPTGTDARLMAAAPAMLEVLEHIAYVLWSTEGVSARQTKDAIAPNPQSSFLE